AIQHVVSGECMDLAGRPIDADPRTHLDWVALDAALKLLIAILGKSNRPVGEKHRRQCNVEHERSVVASAEPAADIGELRVDARRLERGAGLAEKERDRRRGLVGRLHAEYELELIRLLIVPGETAFRLEKQ